MLDLLLKLIDKGIELLQEGQRRRKEFFESVVTPLHSHFEKLYEDHIRTFAKTREMLLDDSKAPKEIASFVEGRLLLEHGTVELLRRLTKRSETQPAFHSRQEKELAQYFENYVSSIAECLVSPVQMDFQSVAYYVALENIVRSLSERSEERVSRKYVLENLQEILLRFQKYYADVQAKYLEIQEYCSS